VASENKGATVQGDPRAGATSKPLDVVFMAALNVTSTSSATSDRAAREIVSGNTGEGEGDGDGRLPRDADALGVEEVEAGGVALGEALLVAVDVEVLLLLPVLVDVAG
jgi:hypothetical protein